MKQTDKINEKADKNINSDTEEREREESFEIDSTYNGQLAK